MAEAAPHLRLARLGAIYQVAVAGQRRTVYWDGELEAPEIETGREPESPHGPLRTLTVRARTSRAAHAPLAVTLRFALPESRPALLWRIEARNLGDAPLWLEALDLARVGQRFQPRSGRSSWRFQLRSLLTHQIDEVQHPAGPAGELALGQPRPDGVAPCLAFFSNGYQSWSFAGALHRHMVQPGTIFGPLGIPKLMNLVTPRFRRPGRFTSDMFGVLGDCHHDLGIVAGFLAQREQFSAVEVLLDDRAPALRLTAQCDGVRLDPESEARRTDWAYLQFIRLSQPDPLGEYVGAVARENGARVPAHVPVGWCSWYHYFDKVTEADVLANLDVIVAERDRLPLDLVQIDDGFQAQVGDWFATKPTFPRGLAWLADQIRARGHTPGLWLAPYMVRSDARLLREHPDWFLRTPAGRLASAGFNWFRWCYGLDPTHPAVRDHVQRLIQTAVQEWGFPYLKLDFLYAAALPGRRYDPCLTRAQAMRLALSDLRAAASPETFLLGCGCPLGSAVGLVDGMRISTDVAPDWDPRLFTPRLDRLLHRETDFVGVRNAIRNTINRAPLHRRWWLNDPDCLLVRDHDTNLSEAEVRSLATVIGLSGGMFMVSDDMGRLPPERQRYVAALLPVLGASARPIDWMGSQMPDLFVLPCAGAAGEWVVAGIFNWENRPRSRSLDVATLGLDPAAEHLVAEFWDQQHWRLPPGEPLRLPDIPPHGARLVALRAWRPPGPALVASSLHFSQGGEIAAWEPEARQLRLRIELGRAAAGEVRLALPGAPASAWAGDDPVAARALGQGIYAFPLAVKRSAQLRVTW